MVLKRLWLVNSSVLMVQSHTVARSGWHVKVNGLASLPRWLGTVLFPHGMGLIPIARHVKRPLFRSLFFLGQVGLLVIL